MSLQQVHLRINDAATGQPTPVRLRITDAAGTYYAPFGRLTEFATGANQDVGGNVQIGSKKWAYIDGTCEILLPPGTLHVEITKGFEYKPIDVTIELITGKMSLRFTIERWIDLRKHGWYSGDTRVHFLTPDAAMLEGQAEDVAVVNLLAQETEGAIPNILAFSGQNFARQSETCGVAVNTFNRCAGLGSLALLHCHRVVYPLTFHDPIRFGDWTLADWCDQCHRKKGLVIWADPLYSDMGAAGAGEPLADLINGGVDALEFTERDATPSSFLEQYYQLCDAGFCVPLAGASAKWNNAISLGAMRTYARLPASQEFSYSSWIEALRAGQAFVSNGPLLDFKVKSPSASSSAPITSREVEISATAGCWTWFDHLEILWNGEIIETAAPTGGPPYCVEIESAFHPPTSGWLAARCVTDRLRGCAPLVFAHSSGILLNARGAPSPNAAGAVRHWLGVIDQMLQGTRTLRLGQRLCHVLEEARTTLERKL